jgi:hypothetical protein
MTCKKCNRPIPDTDLACPACLAASNLAALLAYQLHPLQAVAKDTASLTTRLIRGTRHVQMFNLNRNVDQYTFCGERIEDGHKRGTMTLDDFVDAAERGLVCERCNVTLGDLMVKGQACSAS